MEDLTRPFILLLTCGDQKGIIAGISDFIFRKGGNIIDAQQHSTDPRNGRFFMRVEFCCSPGESALSLSNAFAPVAEALGAQWRIYDAGHRMSMGIMVSRPDHCLFELLYLWRSGELRADIPFVISNSESHRTLVSQFGIPFHFIPASSADRREGEILQAARKADLLVLARYMLTLSPDFLSSFGKDIINIHHGFLPSFKGANPYRQAYEKGVKVIGATAHFVNEKLDEGPIICQEVERVSHRDDLASLVRKGKSLEKRALASAVNAYLDHRVIRYGETTVVF